MYWISGRYIGRAKFTFLAVAYITHVQCSAFSKNSRTFHRQIVRDPSKSELTSGFKEFQHGPSNSYLLNKLGHGDRASAHAGGVLVWNVNMSWYIFHSPLNGDQVIKPSTDSTPSTTASSSYRILDDFLYHHISFETQPCHTSTHSHNARISHRPPQSGDLDTHRLDSSSSRNSNSRHLQLLTILNKNRTCQSVWKGASVHFITSRQHWNFEPRH